jgi:hypothetical protein
MVTPLTLADLWDLEVPLHIAKRLERKPRTIQNIVIRRLNGFPVWPASRGLTLKVDTRLNLVSLTPDR